MVYLGNRQLTGLLFLVLFLGYGYFAQDIELDFWSQEDAFNARTMPYLIAAGGSICALILLLSPNTPAASGQKQSLQLMPVLSLVVLMTAYAFAFEWLGFLTATPLFLASGMCLLGERRISVILIASLPVTAVFYGLMAALDIQLAPGELWYQIGLLS